MRTAVQIEETQAKRPAFERNEPRTRQSIMQIASMPVARREQIDRLDALKILIRSLLDQLDYLTEPGNSPEESELSLHAMVRRFETELIRHALLRTGGKQRQAARLLREKKTTLNAKIIRYGIRVAAPDAEATHLRGGE